jgi:hypothetical protein
MILIFLIFLIALIIIFVIASTDYFNNYNSTFPNKYFNLQVRNVVGNSQVPTPRVSNSNLINSWRRKLDKWKKGEELPDYRGPMKWETKPIIPSLPTLGEYKDIFYRDNSVDFTGGNFSKEMTNTKRDWLRILNKKPGEPAVIESQSGNTLVIPPIEYTNSGQEKDFTNIGKFSQYASPKVKKAFWKLVAETIEYVINNTTQNRIWVYTEGSGVAYLHVRICFEPGHQKNFRNV